eukprot:2845513-Prymnesium_polylepis.1
MHGQRTSCAQRRAESGGRCARHAFMRVCAARPAAPPHLSLDTCPHTYPSGRGLAIQRCSSRRTKGERYRSY